jgi:hypothetical protein
MKFHIICDAYNSLPFIKEVDTENLAAVTAEIRGIESSFMPKFVYSPEQESFYRIVKVYPDVEGEEPQVFLSDDAYEVLGSNTEPEYFKRIGESE